MKITKKIEYKGILSETDMKYKKYKLLYACILFIIIVYSLVSLLPVVWILLSGFKDVKEMYAIPPTIFPKTFDIMKIARAWNTMQFYKYYINTFIMAGGAVVFNLIISGFAGYVLSRLKPPGHKIIFTVCFWIMLLPGTMSTVPLYMTIKDLYLMDSFAAIWLIGAADAFGIILFKNFFDGISSSLIEAAKIDGASNLRIFFKIIMPLSVPIFMVQGIFCFNAQLGQFFWPYLIISDPNKTVLGVQIFKMKSSNLSMDYQMIALLFAMLPQLVIFAIFQRRIIGGVNIGGVKG